MASFSSRDASPIPPLEERNKIRRFFNLTSWIYPLIERHLVPRYRETLERLNLPPRLTVLDAGTGSGTLAAAFHRRGHRVTGLDFSTLLLNSARRRFPGITFREFDLARLEKIPDGSFDILSAGHLLHGLPPDFRVWVLTQFHRISRHYVVILDYGPGGGWPVRLIEWIEGSYYRQFIASSREKEFSAAGLALLLTFSDSPFGRAWLCRPAEPM